MGLAQLHVNKPGADRGRRWGDMVVVSHPISIPAEAEVPEWHGHGHGTFSQRGGGYSMSMSMSLGFYHLSGNRDEM